MINRASCRNQIVALIATLLLLHFVQAQTSANNSTTTAACQPLDCTSNCSPGCSSDQVCIKKTMTNCAICPTLLCMSRTALGLPPAASSSSSSTAASANQSGSNDTGTLVGGIVGGLVGAGLLAGLGVYLYIKKRGKRGKLPFAFTNGNRSHLGASQEKFQQPYLNSQELTPHPAVIAALARQQSSHTPSNYIGLADMATTNSPQGQASSHPNNNNNNNTTTLHSINTPLYNSTTTNPAYLLNDSNAPIMTESSVPEEFESRIALQNKRISEIITSSNSNNNNRLSQQYQPQTRFSAYASTDDDDFDSDTDRHSTLSSSTTQSNYLPQTATATPVQAVQVTRAKPQIMRVNSVKSTSGLNRSESVRTVLTAITDLHEFPPTPSSRSTGDNPFHDANTIQQ